MCITIRLLLMVSSPIYVFGMIGIDNTIQTHEIPQGLKDWMHTAQSGFMIGSEPTPKQFVFRCGNFLPGQHWFGVSNNEMFNTYLPPYDDAPELIYYYEFTGSYSYGPTFEKQYFFREWQARHVFDSFTNTECIDIMKYWNNDFYTSRHYDTLFYYTDQYDKLNSTTCVVKQKCAFFVYFDNYVGRDQQKVSLEDFMRGPGNEWAPLFCNSCMQDSCPATCKNGEYGSQTSVIDEFDKQTQRITCLACAPGTWMTCLKQETCTYNVPSSPLLSHVIPLGRDVHTIGYGPFDGCYPCRLAKDRYHYINTSKTQFIQNDSYICPGGASPPQPCPHGFLPNREYTECVCPEGQYNSGVETCLSCPTGYYCTNGIKTQCPKHYFQDQHGATTCNACAYPATDRGIAAVTCAYGKQLSFCDPAVQFSQTQSLLLNCKPCKQCSRAFLNTSGAGVFQCYQ